MAGNVPAQSLIIVEEYADCQRNIVLVDIQNGIFTSCNILSRNDFQTFEVNQEKGQWRSIFI